MNPIIAIVYSEFNHEITGALKQGAVDRLAELGINSTQIEMIAVPGAVEIPYVALLLAKQHKFDAIITLGCVIRGETTHYDYVCDQVSQGCQRVMLDHEIPVIFGVLTTEMKRKPLIEWVVRTDIKVVKQQTRHSP
jgi:6,7-dimethyl-8-ribityllumazine synthase